MRSPMVPVSAADDQSRRPERLNQIELTATVRDGTRTEELSDE
jgi:hypothetical protein